MGQRYGAADVFLPNAGGGKFYYEVTLELKNNECMIVMDCIAKQLENMDKTHDVVAMFGWIDSEWEFSTAQVCHFSPLL